MSYTNKLHVLELAVFEHKYGKIEQSFNKLSEIVTDLQDHNTCKNIEKITAPMQGFMQLLQKQKQTSGFGAYNIDESSSEHLKHNLYSQIGAVQAFSELMLEEKNLDQNAQPAILLAQISHAASDVIKSIDENFSDNSYNQNTSYLQLEESLALYGNRYDGYTALIIDHSPYNREILSHRLSQYGINVHAFDTGKAGLDYAFANTVDIILLYAVMPGVSGLNILQRIKENPKTKDVPVLIVSAASDSNVIAQYIQYGDHDYLSVPFNTTILNARVRTCLDKRRLLAESLSKDKEYIKIKRTLQSTIDRLNTPTAFVDKSGDIKMCNQAFINLYPDAVCRNSLCLFAIVNGDSQHAAHDKQSYEEVSTGSYTITDSSERKVEIVIKDTAGGYLLVEVHLAKKAADL